MAKNKDKPLNMTSYNSKLVGVTFEGRQDVIAGLIGREELRFRREPDNQYDSNAVAIDVLTKTLQGINEEGDEEWKPIGYIARDKNAELAEVLTNGKEAHITLSDITGGGDKALGVNVYIEYEKELKPLLPSAAIPVKDIFGNEIFYDEANHRYTNSLGEVYLSGSVYAGDDDFDGEYWASYFVETYGLDKSDKQRILDMWNCNGEASRNFGTALHAAIELYGTYHDIADKIDMDLKTKKRKMLDKNTEKNSALSKLPYLNRVAKSFFTSERLAETAMYEVLVVDHKNKRAGRIDRLILLPDGSYEIRDMKTNNKKMGTKEKRGYAKQLSFYADLILANGRTLGDNPTIIHHWNDTDWEDVPLEKIDTLEPEVTGSLSRQG